MSEALKYRIKDGDKLDGPSLSYRFLDIDRRLTGLEHLKIDYEAAVSAMQNSAVNRLNGAVLPLVEQVKADAERVQSILNNAGKLVVREELDDALAEPAASDYTYDAKGLIIRVESRLPGARTRVTSYEYDAKGNISKEETTEGKTVRTVLYRYKDKQLIGFDATERTIK